MRILIKKDGPSRIYLHADFEVSNSDRVREVKASWSASQVVTALGINDIDEVYNFYQNLSVPGIDMTSISRYQLRITRYMAFDFPEIIRGVIKQIIISYHLDASTLEIGEGVGWGDDIFEIVTAKYLPSLDIK